MKGNKIEIKKHIVPIFSLIMIEILYFAFGANSRNIITIPMIQFAHGTIQLIATRILLLIINSAGIYLILSMGCFSRTFVSFLDIAKKIMLSFVIRLIFDLVTFFPIKLDYTFSLQITVDTLYIICIFAVFNKSFRPKGSRLEWKTSNRILAVSIPFVLILFVAYNLSNYHNFETLQNYITEKYLSGIPNDIYGTMSFRDNTITSIYYCFVSTIMYFFFSFSGISKNDENSKESANISKITVRCFLIVFLSVLLYITKAWIFPNGIISRISLRKSNFITNSDEKHFNENHTNINVYRISSENTEECVYSEYYVTLSYGNDRIAKFRRNITDTENKLIEIDDKLTIYNTQALMYLEDEKPVVIFTEDINSMSESDKITDSLEKLISLGYFDFLENTYDYMYKYSPDFLEESLKLYSSGSYSKSLNDNISEAYIVKYAENALNNDFS